MNFILVGILTIPSRINIWLHNSSMRNPLIHFLIVMSMFTLNVMLSYVEHEDRSVTVTPGAVLSTV